MRYEPCCRLNLVGNRRVLDVVLSMLIISTSTSYAAEPTAEQLEFFETRIRPALAKYCYECHQTGPDMEGELALDHPGGWLKGGDGGPALLPGNPEKSAIYQAVLRSDTDIAMPPKKHVPKGVVEDLHRWIKMGAPAPKSDPPKVAIKQSWDWAKLRGEHWAWRAVELPQIPSVKNAKWAHNDIDRFILARLEKEGMYPGKPAQKAALLRRTYLGMLGLPPTPAEVDEFVSGRKTWNQVIEKLLASPHYGERWGRHWLDVARYSDGFGGFLDQTGLPNAWRYRDWVIRATNDDMSIDRFLRLQIAGDQLENGKHAVATGFFAVGPTYRSDGGDPDSEAAAKSETLDDRVDTLGRGMLGITLGCSRCHDHKFDPFPISDYYSIAGIFNNTAIREVSLASEAEVKAFKDAEAAVRDSQNKLNNRVNEISKSLVDAELKRFSVYLLASWDYVNLEKKPNIEEFARERGLAGTLFAKGAGHFGSTQKNQKIPVLKAWFETHSKEAAQAIEKKLLALRPADEKAKKTPEWNDLWRQIDGRFRPINNESLKKDVSDQDAAEIVSLTASLESLKKKMPAKYAVAHGLGEAGSKNMNVALRGNLRKPGDEAPRRFLRLFGGDETPKYEKGSGRVELAEAVVAADNPLTARVFVNRVWAHHFGRGLVRTPSNFGSLGEKPTHPKLLDFLTAQFTKGGWSLKDLHRSILRSAAYQMSSRFDAKMHAKDGDNRLLWRTSPQKLDAEAWRDSVLFVTGELKDTVGGEPFEDLSNDFRRTLYAKTSRNGDKFKSDEFLQLFDFPTPRASVARRISTITPQQSLYRLNNPFFIGRAKAFASRLEREGKTVDERIDQAYKLLFSRSPEPAELEAGKRFLAGEDAEGEKTTLTRAERYAQALLATNEFIFVE